MRLDNQKKQKRMTAIKKNSSKKLATGEVLAAAYGINTQRVKTTEKNKTIINNNISEYKVVFFIFPLLQVRKLSVQFSVFRRC